MLNYNSNKRKRVLLVSTNNSGTTKRIAQWLVAFRAQIIFVNTSHDKFQISGYSLQDNSFTFTVNGSEFNSKDFSCVYFSSGSIMLRNYSGIEVDRQNFDDVNNAFQHYMTAYEHTISELSYDSLHSLNTYGSNNGGCVNKIEMLKYAHQAGFKIPKSILTSTKSDVVLFQKEVGEIITKSLNLNLFFLDKERNELMHNLTSAISYEDIMNFPKEFPLSLFQENLQKVLELRVFFIDDLVFSASIFSQNDANTVQDYRNYNNGNPNRVVPFELDDVEKQRLNKFKELTGIRTGSVDMVLTTKGEYYFLEINPQGIFSGISDSCNFNLEKAIAQKLTMEVC